MFEIKEIIRSQLLSKNKKAMGIIGPAGVGKSDLIKELALELDRPIIELRAGYKTPGDLIGVPYAETNVVINGEIYSVDNKEIENIIEEYKLSVLNAAYFHYILTTEEKSTFLKQFHIIKDIIKNEQLSIQDAIKYYNYTKKEEVIKEQAQKYLSELKQKQVNYEVEKLTAFLKPKWLLQLQHTPNGIFLLEEISNASQEVQGALYEVLLDWAINNIQIPKTVNIIFTGNRSEDAIGIASDLQSTFYTRGTLLKIEKSDVNFEDWKVWAFNKKIHPAIVSYLDVNNNSLLHDPIENSSYCTPRTWAILSNNLYDNEHLYKPETMEIWERVVRRLILTNIPEESNFATHYIDGMKLEKPLEYIKHPNKYYRNHEMFMQITYNLAYFLTSTEVFHKEIIEFFEVLSNREGLMELPTLISITNSINNEWVKRFQNINLDMGLELGKIISYKIDEMKKMKNGNF